MKEEWFWIVSVSELYMYQRENKEGCHGIGIGNSYIILKREYEEKR